MDDLKLTHMRHQFNEEFMDALTISRISPGLLQKLTVFLCEYPDYLDQHLFCAWLSGLLAREMGLDARKSARIVVAALVRDLGLLHIDPDILSGNRRLSPAQWRSMQAHTVIGKFIAEETGRLAPDQLVGILEHHERFDGSGYPQAKASSRLQVEGQVIAMADVISSVRFKQFKNTGRGLRDTKAFIQMNAASFHPDVYRAVFSIYKNSHLERASDHTHASVSEFIQHLKARTDGIDAVTKALERVMLYLNNLDGHQEAFKILRFSLQVLQMIKRSGLAGFELKQWLNELDEEPEQDDIAELVEIELMQNELYWQFSHVGRNLETFFSDHADRHDPQVRDLQKYTERTINNTLKGAAYAAIQT